MARRALFASLAAVALGLGAAAQGAASADPALAHAHKLEGLRHGYNLDYPEAFASFQAATRADPDDPAPARFAAITFWMRLLFEQGAFTVEDYLGQTRATVERRTPDPQLVAEFNEHLRRAFTLAERRLRARPGDASAHFELGSTAAVNASYLATIEGRVAGSFGSGRRAYLMHKRAMELDPSRKDASLIVGAYRYTVAGLPFHVRFVARIAGIAGGREEGLRLVEQAAVHPGPVQSNALLTLILLYNRESRYDDALRVVKDLQARYPRNRLFWLEQAGTLLRAGRPGEALGAVDEGLRRTAGDSRPRAFGEVARWRYVRGATLAALGRRDEALRDLDAALAGEAPPWVHGRARLERGRVFDLAGERAAAVAEYEAAGRACRVARDEECASEAKRLASRPFRRSGA